MNWATRVYYDPPPVFYHNVEGGVIESDLLDFDLEILESRQGRVIFAITNAEITWTGGFSLGDGDLFKAASPDEPELIVHRGNEDITVQE
jgi:hypothetical protein